MFTLKIHTVDSPQPLYLSAAAASTYSLSPNFNAIELRAVVHLFRHLPSSGASTSHPAATSLSNPSSRTTALFVAAVPNFLAPEEFILFCGSQLTHFSQLLFLRNDGMEDRYSVLIWLENQVTADGFYCNFNGKRFKPSEVPSPGSQTHIRIMGYMLIQDQGKKEMIRLALDGKPLFVSLINQAKT
ncbi:hypothetical protein RJ639_042296 [Escallonia herrerae]|uniref:Uncharacterized protein n=1 Tax=Escallonia herrerae TaxID=1293975 RepID=A0AA88WEX0_9ASTE|nr:hypothetical protein RJ639_042296 [Escallonia herrerae]